MVTDQLWDKTISPNDRPFVDFIIEPWAPASCDSSNGFVMTDYALCAETGRNDPPAPQPTGPESSPSFVYFDGNSCLLDQSQPLPDGFSCCNVTTWQFQAAQCERPGSAVFVADDTPPPRPPSGLPVSAAAASEAVRHAVTVRQQRLLGGLQEQEQPLVRRTQDHGPARQNRTLLVQSVRRDVRDRLLRFLPRRRARKQ